MRKGTSDTLYKLGMLHFKYNEITKATYHATQGLDCTAETNLRKMQQNEAFLE